MNEFTIHKNTHTNFTINLYKPIEALCMSISNQLPGVSVSCDYYSCSFNASNLQTFQEFVDTETTCNGTYQMRYDNVVNLVNGLTNQISFVTNNYKKRFFMTQPKNIIVLDNGDKFLYISTNELLDVKDEHICIHRPFSKVNGFLSNELSNVTLLPSIIHSNSIYCSIGMLATFCLTGDKTDNNIDSIYGTKLYWCIKRLINDRCFVY